MEVAETNMKKLFLLTAMIFGLAIMAKAELTATAVTAVYPGECPKAAMDVGADGIASFYPAVVYTSGNDVEVVIFGEKFSIIKQFTLHDVVNPSTGKAPSGIWLESVDMQSVVVFKNFFVKNDKWCVVLGQGHETPIFVIDEDGSDLGTLPDCCSNPCIFLDGFMSGTPYLLAAVVYERDFQLYTFTGTSAIEANKVATFPKAYPNPLPAGATFTVDFGRVADTATFFSVLDMNGRQVYRTKVKPGDASLELFGARFGRGQYVYTVVYGDGETISGKLLAE